MTEEEIFEKIKKLNENIPDEETRETVQQEVQVLSAYWRLKKNKKE